MKKYITFVTIVLTMILLTSCANYHDVSPCLANIEKVGFWHGVWHGMIQPYSFIGSLFSDDIAVYAINNNGAWYNFGFVGGFGLLVRIVGGIIKAMLAK